MSYAQDATWPARHPPSTGLWHHLPKAARPAPRSVHGWRGTGPRYPRPELQLHGRSIGARKPPDAGLPTHNARISFQVKVDRHQRSGRKFDLVSTLDLGLM